MYWSSSLRTTETFRPCGLLQNTKICQIPQKGVESYLDLDEGQKTLNYCCIAWIGTRSIQIVMKSVWTNYLKKNLVKFSVTLCRHFLFSVFRIKTMQFEIWDSPFVSMWNLKLFRENIKLYLLVFLLYFNFWFEFRLEN